MALERAKTEDTITKYINDNTVVLFMKGTADAPMCGFSATVVQILKEFGITFKDVNVLEDQNIREGIKVYTDWPTIPQLYVRKNFIGGCDIVRSMYQSGELVKFFEQEQILAS